MVAYALVASRLNHCKRFHVTLPMKLVQKLQIVQNAVAQLLTEADYHHRVMLLLKELHPLPISYQTLFKVLVYKAYRAWDQNIRVYYSLYTQPMTAL